MSVHGRPCRALATQWPWTWWPLTTRCSAIVTVDVSLRLKRIVVPRGRARAVTVEARRLTAAGAARDRALTAVDLAPTANVDGEKLRPVTTGGVWCVAPGDCGASGSATIWT